MAEAKRQDIVEWLEWYAALEEDDAASRLRESAAVIATLAAEVKAWRDGRLGTDASGCVVGLRDIMAATNRLPRAAEILGGE